MGTKGYKDIMCNINYKMTYKEIVIGLIETNKNQIMKIMKVENITLQPAIILWINRNRAKIDNYLIIHSDDLNVKLDNRIGI